MQVSRSYAFKRVQDSDCLLIKASMKKEKHFFLSHFLAKMLQRYPISIYVYSILISEIIFIDQSKKWF